jgi:myosin heavy subunit
MYFAMSHNEIFGARIKNYLLEKSRVITVSAQERGYHAFYFLMRGAEKEYLKKLKLVDAKGEKLKWEGMNYIKDGGAPGLPEKHDIDGWNEIEGTIKSLKFTEEQHHAIWRVTAAVILLG